MKIVCIGNSIVNGFPLKRSQCFVSLWREASGHEIINKGENGDISPNIVLRFQRDVLAHKPAAVVVLTGTNDFIYQMETPDGVLRYMNQMVLTARTNAIEPILITPLLTNPAMASRLWIPEVDYNAVNDNLVALRALMLEYGDTNKIRIIDAQMEFASLYTEENEEIYLIDGLHPTAEGHKAIAEFFSF